MANADVKELVQNLQAEIRMILDRFVKIQGDKRVKSTMSPGERDDLAQKLPKLLEPVAVAGAVIPSDRRVSLLALGAFIAVGIIPVTKKNREEWDDLKKSCVADLADLPDYYDEV